MKVIKEKNAFGEFELTSTDVKHYIKKFRGHDFIWNNGVLYCYGSDKGYWVADKEGLKMRDYIGGELYETLKEIYFQCYFDHLSADVRKRTEGRLLKLKTLPFQKEIVEKTKENFSSDDDIFDNNDSLLGFTNKVYDLNVGQFRKYRQSDMVSITTGYEWAEPTTQELNTIMELIKSIMPKEEERECYLRILSTGLSGLVLEKFIILNGVGRNGKGLTNDLYLCALGNYGMIGNNSLLTENSKMGANPEKSNIHKKRYVVFREPSSRVKFDNCAIKDLTGGGTFSARGLYQSDTKKKYSLTCVVECNKKPSLAESPQVAEVERVIDIQFRNTFTDKEEDIDAEYGIYRSNPKFKELNFQLQHRCAFLKILMDAYQRYTADQCHLKIPKSIKERSNEYLENSSELYQWILDTYEKTDNKKDMVKIKDMYSTFKTSDFYHDLSKSDRRKFNQDYFKKEIVENVFLRRHHQERQEIDNVQYYNFLWGFKQKEYHLWDSEGQNICI